MQGGASKEQEPTHPMITRSRAGVVKRNPEYANAIFDEPKSVRSALKCLDWLLAMKDEHS